MSQTHNHQQEKNTTKTLELSEKFVSVWSLLYEILIANTYYTLGLSLNVKFFTGSMAMKFNT